MKTLYNTQFLIANNYFNHLYEHGNLSDEKTKQTLFSILIIDCLEYFKEYLTEEFEQDINRILHNLECCNCTINILKDLDNCSC